MKKIFCTIILCYLAYLTSVTSQLCVDLANPLQNTDQPFRLWDEARGLGMMYSSLAVQENIGLSTARTVRYLTTTTDRYQALIVTLLSNGYLVDSQDHYTFGGNHRWKFNDYDNPIQPTSPGFINFITQDGYLTRFSDPANYILITQPTNVEGTWWRSSDISLGLNVIFNSYTANPVDLTSLSSVFYIDGT